MINSRKTNEREFNIFFEVLNNPFFVIFNIGIFVIEILFIEYGGQFVRCANLTMGQHLTAAFFASTVLVFGVICKFFPH